MRRARRAATRLTPIPPALTVRAAAPDMTARALSCARPPQNISKSINGRIEQTMAGRGAGDGGGLKLVQSDAPVAKSGLGRSGKAKAAAKKEKKKSGRGK